MMLDLLGLDFWVKQNKGNMMSTKKSVEESVSFKISLWHGYVLSGIFLLYGGVQIVLSVLDKNYNTMMQMILFAALGLILFMFALMYSERKKLGLYGIVAMNALVIVFGMMGYQIIENMILAVLSAIVLYLIYSEKNRSFL